MRADPPSGHRGRFYAGQFLLTAATLILRAGAGSWLSERVRLDSRVAFGAWAVALSVYVANLSWWLPGLLASQRGAQTVARAGRCLAVIAPAGLLMGFGCSPPGSR